jgi:NitT/TauT family transport system permease protein
VPELDREAVLWARESVRARQATRRDRLRILAGQALLLALLLGWWAWASGRVVDRLFLSDPVSVARAFWSILLKGTLWYHLRFTLTETLLGYVIGAGLGLAGALVVSMIPAGESVLRPFVLLAYATPKIALAPLMIIWFGIGMLPKVLLAATFVFFVVFLSTLAGVATVSPELVSVVRVMGAAPLSVFRKVVLPSALPFIVTALRITIPAALIGAIIGEFISSNRGVGYLINAASSRYATAEVFAGIGSLLVLVLCMNAGLSLLERSWFRWAPRSARNEVGRPA